MDSLGIKLPMKVDMPLTKNQIKIFFFFSIFHILTLLGDGAGPLELNWLLLTFSA